MNIALERSLGSLTAELERVLAYWTDELADLGGDTTAANWVMFRPLRMRHEEHWSDWLAHLLHASKDMGLVQDLLQETVRLQPGEAASLDVKREYPPGGERRADIVLHNQRWGIQIEVKLHDRNYEKTKDTGKFVRDVFAAKGIEPEHWQDVLLLPDPAWIDDDQARALEGVELLTWRQVALALRRRLQQRQDSTPWRVWAWTFLGCIEQQILGLPRIAVGADRHVSPGHGTHSAASFALLLAYLQEATKP